MSSTAPQFSCEACGKRYRWKAELAGKKVKCKCSHVMRVPESVDAVEPDEPAMFELADTETTHQPPPPKPKPEPPVSGSKLGSGSTQRIDPSSSAVDQYGLSGDSELGMDPPRDAGASPAAGASGGDACPGCGAALAPGAVLCINCGYNTATGKKLGAASVAMDSDTSPAPRGAAAGAAAKLGGMLTQMKGGASTSKEHISLGDAGDDKLWKLKQVVIPTALIVVGLILRALDATLAGNDPTTTGPSVGVAIMGTLLMAVIGTALMVGAAFITAKIMEMSFGPLGTAVLKFAAVTLAPGAIAGIAARYTGDWGFFVGFPIEIGLYFGLLFWLFDLDLFEVVVLAVINWVIQNFITAIILTMLLAALGSN